VEELRWYLYNGVIELFGEKGLSGCRRRETAAGEDDILINARCVQVCAYRGGGLYIYIYIYIHIL